MFELPEILPFASSCGIQRVTVTPQEVVHRLPLARGVMDQRGGVHIGAVFTLAHVSAAAALALNFDLSQVSFRLREARVRTHRYGRTDLECRVVVPAAEVARIKAALEADGRAEFIRNVAVTDASGALVAELDVAFSFRTLR